MQGGKITKGRLNRLCPGVAVHKNQNKRPNTGEDNTTENCYNYC